MANRLRAAHLAPRLPACAREMLRDRVDQTPYHHVDRRKHRDELIPMRLVAELFHVEDHPLVAQRDEIEVTERGQRKAATRRLAPRNGNPEALGVEGERPAPLFGADAEIL